MTTQAREPSGFFGQWVLPKILDLSNLDQDKKTLQLLNIKDNIKVTNNHLAKDVGDEAMILSSIAPTWIGSDRIKSSLHFTYNNYENIEVFIPTYESGLSSTYKKDKFKYS